VNVDVREAGGDSRRVSRFLAVNDPAAVLAAELGRPFEDYRRRWELARRFQEIPPFPLHVDYELKFACNLRCPMCLWGLPEPLRRHAGQSDAELSAAVAAELIDEGLERGQASIGFGGLWEPLTSPDLAELVAYGRGRGLVEAMFNTNGLLLGGAVSRALIKAGLTRLMISLDAVEESTYALMRPGSDLRRVEENIREFLALRREAGRRLPVVRLSFCLTSLNEGEFDRFVERWAGVVDFFSLQCYGRYSSDAPSLFPARGVDDKPSGRCAQPRKRLLIRHNGQALPCCDLSGLDLAVGEIGRGSLAEIWAGEPLRTLRAQLEGRSDSAPPESCRRCQAKYEP
jgi:radical SAM protein with 4Fe4S-binding SPASM domain